MSSLDNDAGALLSVAVGRVEVWSGIAGLSAVPFCIFIRSAFDLAFTILSDNSSIALLSPSNALLTAIAIMSSLDIDAGALLMGFCTDAVAAGAACADETLSGIAGLSAVPLLILISNALALPLVITSGVSFKSPISPSNALLTITATL